MRKDKMLELARLFSQNDTIPGLAKSKLEHFRQELQRRGVSESQEQFIVSGIKEGYTVAIVTSPDIFWVKRQ